MSRKKEENFYDFTQLSGRIRYIRDYFGMSQQAFGEKIGLKGTQIRDMEIKGVNIRGELALLIEKVYGVNHYWLITGEGEPFISTKADENQWLSSMLEQNAELRDLVINIVKTYESAQKAIRALIKSSPSGTITQVKENTQEHD